MRPLITLLALCFSNTLVFSQPYTPICKVVLDGRIPKDFSPQTFDNNGPNPFNPSLVKGDSVRFSEVVNFPEVPPSVFDWQAKPLQISINDKSIYQEQQGVRQTGLVFASNTGTDDVTNIGVKTFHWSIHQPPIHQRPLNLTHEYMNVIHARNDNSGYQFRLTTGQLLKNNGEHPFTHWKMLNEKEQVVFSTLMDFHEWQNFAVTLDFNANTIRVYYSKGNDELKDVTGELENDNSGRGRFEIGIYKKPVAPNMNRDGYLTSGSQELLANGDETQIYGGIFVEDSANSCVTK